MNELDGFRAALRQPPEEPFAEPDLARIMADGTRLRRRRRVLTGAAGVAAAAAVVLVVVFAIQLRQPAPAPVAQPPSPAPTVSATSTAAPAEQPMGDVVGTGIRTSDGEIVLYARAVNEPTLPNVRFGLVAGLRSGSSLQAVLATNETRGTDLSFGFHATDGGEVVRNQPIPVFGYFSGRAARITTTVHGKTVEARLATWTADSTVVIFWFDPAEVPNSAVLTPLIAYDADGKRLTK
ncbi:MULTISPECIES: hypothetical protein [Amycolatopsis]|uniref:Uncharacterized protein n=1 Tax=Amycolatopsis bullii TaxID=941987 RepID=A0ABQ3K969_9PSEU|nr:hypothetical protein [Amycolatopsis bullii]GHG05599.1 hypothetical protein GCM10017567_22260 [Amycolatopsis bullii]